MLCFIGLRRPRRDDAAFALMIFTLRHLPPFSRRATPLSADAAELRRFDADVPLMPPAPS